MPWTELSWFKFTIHSNTSCWDTSELNLKVSLSQSFLAKNFASSISPWIVTLDALQPFKTDGPKPLKKQLPYLQQKGKKSYDINLEVAIQPEKAKEKVEEICKKLLTNIVIEDYTINYK